MDASLLHTLTEDLAALLSEVTAGDLRQPTSDGSGDLGDLYLRLIARNVTVTSIVTGRETLRGRWHDPWERSSLGASRDPDGGCALDNGYRETAWLLERAFTSTDDRAQLYEVPDVPGAVDLTTLYVLQVRTTIAHTCDVAETLGLPHRPFAQVTHRMLRGVAPGPLV